MSDVTEHGKRFLGRTAIVTGASRGIGLAIAERLLQEGAAVVVTGRKQETLDEALEILEHPDRVLAVAGRADDAAHQRRTVDAAMERFGGIDLLVNNAGINPVHGPLMDLDLSAARKIVEVNCLAMIAWTQLVHRRWMARHGGAVVNVASTSGVRPSPGIAMYGSTKSMLMHLTANLALELAPAIRVNAVAPALIKTRFAAALYDGREDLVAERYPLRRLGAPTDIGNAVAFLLSDDAAWITGQTLVVDGGLMLTGGE